MIWLSLCRLTNVLILLAVVIASMAFSPHVVAGDPVTLRMITWMPARLMPYTILQEWADEIRKASGGSLTVSIDPKPTTKAPQQYDLIKAGKGDLAFIIPAYTADRFPMLLAAELPFLSPNVEDGSQALWEWYSAHIGDKEFGPVKLLTLWLPGAGVLHSKREIKTLEDIKGLKIRVPGGTSYDVAKALGGIPVALPSTKQMESLQQGVTEATITGWNAVKNFRLETVLKYHLEAPKGSLYTAPLIVGINREKFASLSPAHQAVLEKLGGAFGAVFLSKRWNAVTREARAAIKAQGNVIQVADQTEYARWREQLAPLEAQWVSTANAKGYDGAALLKDLKATMKKYADRS